MVKPALNCYQGLGYPRLNFIPRAAVGHYSHASANRKIYPLIFSFDILLKHFTF